MPNQNSGCLGFLLPRKAIDQNQQYNMPNGNKTNSLGSQSGLAGQPLPYGKKNTILNKTEMYFYKLLQEVVQGRAVIYPKIGLKEIFYVNSNNRSEQTTYYNRIDRKSIDFLICSINSLKPMCAVELTDSSDYSAEKCQKESFIDELFKKVDLPLVRFDIKKSYTMSDIAQKVNGVFNVNASEVRTGSPVQVSEPFCPKCGVKMVLRVSKKGENFGREFYGCPNYPNCRETLPK